MAGDRRVQRGDPPRERVCLRPDSLFGPCCFLYILSSLLAPGCLISPCNELRGLGCLHALHAYQLLLQDFFRVYGAASARQQLTRAAVRKALASGPHGFTPLDACLIHHASLVNDAYDRWYVSWAKAVQARRTASFLPCNLACRGLPVTCAPTMHPLHACGR